MVHPITHIPSAGVEQVCDTHFRRKENTEKNGDIYTEEMESQDIHPSSYRSLANILNNQRVSVRMRTVYDVSTHNSLDTALHPTNNP